MSIAGDLDWEAADEAGVYDARNLVPEPAAEDMLASSPVFRNLCVETLYGGSSRRLGSLTAFWLSDMCSRKFCCICSSRGFFCSLTFAFDVEHAKNIYLAT